MSRPIPCDTCPDEAKHEASFLMGNLENGEQLALCPSCVVIWGLEMAKAVLAPAQVLEALGLDVAALTPQEDPAPPAPKRAPRTRRGADNGADAIKHEAARRAHQAAEEDRVDWAAPEGLEEPATAAPD